MGGCVMLSLQFCTKELWGFAQCAMPSLAHAEARCLGNHCCTVAASLLWLPSRTLYTRIDDGGHPSAGATLSWLIGPVQSRCRPRTPRVYLATAQQTQQSRAQPCYNAGTCTTASAAVHMISTVLHSAVRTLLESTCVSQCQHNARAPASKTPIAGSDRWTAATRWAPVPGSALS